MSIQDFTKYQKEKLADGLYQAESIGCLEGFIFWCPCKIFL